MKYRKPVIALIAIILALVLTTGTVFAVRLLLSSDEVAEGLGETALAEAFASPDAVTVNKTVDTGDFLITFMGIVSGKDLMTCYSEDDTAAREFTDNEKSYITVAVERTDGNPIEPEDETLLHITPLISGYQPWVVNLFSLSDGAYGYHSGGVLYYLMTFDTLEIFADREVSLFIYSDHLAPGINVFSFNEATGEIGYAESYSGIRAEFSVPLDSSKADPEAARGLIESWGYTVDENGMIAFGDDSGEDDPVDDMGVDCSDWIAAMDVQLAGYVDAYITAEGQNLDGNAVITVESRDSNGDGVDAYITAEGQNLDGNAVITVEARDSNGDGVDDTFLYLITG